MEQKKMSKVSSDHKKAYYLFCMFCPSSQNLYQVSQVLQDIQELNSRHNLVTMEFWKFQVS